MTRAIDPLEPPDGSHAEQTALAIVGPRVIRTRKAVPAASRSVDDLRAAVPADVQKCVDATGARAGHDDRHASQIVSEKVARARDVTRQAEDQRVVREETLALEG